MNKCCFPSNIFLPTNTSFSPKLPASKNLHAKQILGGTDASGAPVQKKERQLVVYDISDSSVLHAVVTSTSRYGRMRTRVVRDCYVPWQNKKKKERQKE